MNLTTPQLQTLKAAIAAETDATFVGYRTNGQTGLMAAWFNGAHPSAKAWNSAARWADIGNAIDFSRYTPSVANMPSDTAGTNRLVGILIKLMVQQNLILLAGSAALMDATDTGNIKAVLDTVTGIQSGSAGAVQAPGGALGVNVANALTRAATRGEAVFGGTDYTDGNVTAKLLTREGDITESDVTAALSA